MFPHGVVRRLNLHTLVPILSSAPTIDDMASARLSIREALDGIAVAQAVRSHMGTLSGINARLKGHMRAVASVARSTMESIDPLADVDLQRVADNMQRDREEWGTLLAEGAA